MVSLAFIVNVDVSSLYVPEKSPFFHKVCNFKLQNHFMYHNSFQLFPS